MKSLIENLDLSAPLRAPVIRRVIQRFNLPEGSEGLDAGCGIGSHTTLLAEAVGPRGRVTGIDLSDEVLAHAAEMASRSGCGGRVDFRQGDVNALPFDDESFDWAWSVDCVGHVSIGEPDAGLRELARVVRPGGTVAILLYSSQLLLPGHPGLEARLNATVSAMTASEKGSSPDHHFMRAMGWFEAAGLDGATARTVAGTVQAPLDDTTRRGLHSLIEMLWGERRSLMTDGDREEFLRLTDPNSKECLLNATDYCGFFTYSLFFGRVAKR